MTPPLCACGTCRAIEAVEVADERCAAKLEADEER